MLWNESSNSCPSCQTHRFSFLLRLPRVRLNDTQMVELSDQGKGTGLCCQLLVWSVLTAVNPCSTQRSQLWQHRSQAASTEDTALNWTLWVHIQTRIQNSNITFSQALPLPSSHWLCDVILLLSPVKFFCIQCLRKHDYPTPPSNIIQMMLYLWKWLQHITVINPVPTNVPLYQYPSLAKLKNK